jgi:hypothetical protein
MFLRPLSLRTYQRSKVKSSRRSVVKQAPLSVLLNFQAGLLDQTPASTTWDRLESWT